MLSMLGRECNSLLVLVMFNAWLGYFHTNVCHYRGTNSQLPANFSCTLLFSRWSSGNRKASGKVQNWKKKMFALFLLLVGLHFLQTLPKRLSVLDPNKAVPPVELTWWYSSIPPTSGCCYFHNTFRPLLSSAFNWPIIKTTTLFLINNCFGEWFWGFWYYN